MRPLAGERRAQAVRDGDRLDPHDLAALDGQRQGIAPDRLDAVDTHAGPRLLDRAGDTRRERPAADAHDDHVHVRQVVEDLETDGPLPGQDERVVERRHERQPPLGLDLVHASPRFADVLAKENHFGAVAAARVHLRADRAGGHHHHGMNAGLVSGQRHCLGVVPRRERDYSGRPLRVRQRPDLVKRPAHLERAGLLEMLRLGVDPPVGDLDAARRQHARRGRGRQNGRAIDAAGDDAAGFVEAFERDDVVGHGESMAPKSRWNPEPSRGIDTGRGNDRRRSAGEREADGPSARRESPIG